VAIAAIETRYAGCRFRSRLEARWAVFFNHLNIRWEYEPQGFHIRRHNHPDTPYLPDFLLPDCGTWVEVKGAEQMLDKPMLCAAATQLPRHPDRGEQGPSLLILGSIPDANPHGFDWGWLGFDITYPSRWGFGAYQKNLRPWHLTGATHTDLDANTSTWLTPVADNDEEGPSTAYIAARSARFEHGENG
jgi:hypothetical protein